MAQLLFQVAVSISVKRGVTVTAPLWEDMNDALPEVKISPYVLFILEALRLLGSFYLLFSA